MTKAAWRLPLIPVNFDGIFHTFDRNGVPGIIVASVADSCFRQVRAEY